MDGRTFPVLHPQQIASVLDLPRPGGSLDNVRLAWDTVSILENWVELLVFPTWEQLDKPTPSRGRTLRNLTVNTFRPYELLPGAWKTGRFDWYTGEEDAKRERLLTTREELEEFAAQVLRDWEMFLMEVGDELSHKDPVVHSNRGDAPFSVLLRSQRWHAAFHHRQLVDFLHAEGVILEGELDVEGFEDLDLPEEIY